ncbi:MAG: bifunctional riboflavin kinase/FAD synthetase [Nitrospirae bacterium]|nr:bifunctional riboflavin kinase/FAD synthetase [Nitrospirota bacterium]MBI3351193.1 bifunctional riboflavin kinase/FAD synthetase [Nitrospirota bacterium]
MSAKFLKKIDEARNLPYPVLALGNFDGVHIGHQAILKKVVERAAAVKGTSIAFTFEPHPIKVLFPDRPLELLSSQEEKLGLIENRGIERIYVIDFTKEFSNQSPREFVKTFLVDGLKIREVFVGSNYGFGKGRSGNVDSLRQYGEEFGFTVNVVTPVRLNGQIVSSSLIRKLLLEGSVDEVVPFLGRPYLLEGEVVEGEMRGRTLGYPTANLLPGDKLIPKDGVYAVTVQVGQNILPGIVYIGTQPTFQKSKRQIEVHLFDYSNKLYGEQLKVYFYGKVRGEIKFPDKDSLVRQIEKDIMTAKNILKSIMC